MAQPFFEISVTTDPPNLAKLWREMPERLLTAWQKSLYAVVAQRGIQYAKRQFRSAPRGLTTPTATAVRTGNLRANYGVSVPRAEESRESGTNIRAASIDFGLMRRSYDERGTGILARALGYGYVHEFGATVTRGKRSWRIPARPAIEPTVAYVTPLLRQRLEADAARLLKNPASHG